METDMVVTHAETIKELAKKLQRSETEWQRVETVLCEQTEEPGNKLIEKEKLEANVHGHGSVVCVVRLLHSGQHSMGFF